MKQLTNRVSIIDALRGFAIILVVLAHILQYTYAPNQDVLFVFRAISAFYMALFMFVSGYVAFFTTNLVTPIQNIFKKFINLGVPFLFWYFIYGFIFERGFERYSFDLILKNIISSTDYGYWFLWTLLLCFVVLNATTWIYRFKIFKRNYIDIIFYSILGIIILNSHYTAFGWGFVRWYFLFFISGFLISKYKDKLVRFVPLAKEIAFVGFPIFVAGAWRNKSPDIIPFLREHSNFFHSLPTIETIYNFTTAMLGIIFFYFVIKEVIKIKLFERILTFIGKYTLDIYVMHLYFVGFFSTAVVTLGTNFISILLDTIFGVIFPIILSSLVIRQSKILKFLFLGQYDKRTPKS